MTETVWSVNIMIGIGLVGLLWVLYYIFSLAENEKENTTHDNISEDHK